MHREGLFSSLTWEVVWRNKGIVRLGGKAGFFPPINKMIAVKKIKPQQLFTVKSTGFLQLHPRAKPALSIKYKNKFLFSGTRARPNPTSSHSNERKNKTTKYANKIYLLNKEHKPFQFLQALCSQHHSCPASPPHTWGSREKGPQDSSNTCVKR